MNDKKVFSAAGLPAALLTAGLWLAGLPAAGQEAGLSIEHPLPVLEFPALLTAIEGQPATLELEPILAAAGAAGWPAEISEPPGLGSARIERNHLSYFAETGFFGSDRLQLAAGPALVRLEVRLLPRFLPFAGRLEPGPLTLGVYDNKFQRFLLCAEPAAADPELPRDCRLAPVRGLRTARSLIPVAWPADKFGGERAALYDLATGELLQLGWDAAGSFLQIVEIRPFGDAGIGGWPVVGDWRGAEGPEMAFVFADGRVVLPATGQQAFWPAATSAAGLHVLGPVRLPADPGGKEKMALFDPKLGHIEWLEPAFAGGSAATGFEPHLGTANDFRRPLAFVSTLPYEGQMVPSFAFLQQDAEGSLALVPGQYLIAKPQTIPIKFPDDPPIGP